MPNKFTPHQKKVFTEAYNRCVINFANLLTEWGEAQLRVFENLSPEEVERVNKGLFQEDADIKDFAKESFLHSVKKYHDECYAEEAAIQGAKEIVRYSKD